MGGVETGLLGRGDELSAVRGLLDAEPVAGLSITGEPGIGKSALLECAVDLAASAGHRVLLARGSEAARTDGFAVLADLLAGIELDAASLDAPLDAPLRSALAAALLREEPDGPIDVRAVVRGAGDLFSRLAGDPLLVAVDDVQWCDPESAQVLARLAREAIPIRYLFTRREGHPMTGIESALRRRALDVLEVGALERDEIGRLLAHRLGLALPRWITAQITDHSRGNPLFALEYGRVLRRRGIPSFGSPLAIPGDLEDLLTQRVADLPSDHRDLLLACAAEPQITDGDLARIAGAEPVRAALAARVLDIDPVSGRVRPAHPMLGAAAWGSAGPAERRRLHLLLAGVLRDEDPTLRHQALGMDRADGELARRLDDAAARAAGVGRTESATELSRLALDLTPPRSPERSMRVLALAGHLSEIGAARDLTALLDRELPELPGGEARARAWMLASEGELSSTEEVLEHLDRAIEEAADLPSLRAQCLSTRASVMAVVLARDIPGALRTGEDAIALDPGALLGASWARATAGLPDLHDVDDLGTASRHSWRGDPEQSRRLLMERIADAERSGDHGDYLLATMLLGEVELRAGSLERAAALIDLADSSGFDDLFETPDVARCRARLAALRGDGAECERWIAPARAAAEASGFGWVALDLLVTEGLAATRVGDLTRAARCLGTVWDRCRREGIANPGAFPVAFELVAARLGTDDLDGAREVATQLTAAAADQANAWALAVSLPADALVRLHDGTGDPRRALDTARTAARDLERMRLSFDAARVRAVAGAFLRRRRQWGSARELLEAAVATFGSLGAVGWIEPVEGELAKLGGRRASGGLLTPAEQNTARLAAEGLSNQQVAHRTATSVRTVEAHLTRVYAKLGISTRRELPRALATHDAAVSPG